MVLGPSKSFAYGKYLLYDTYSYKLMPVLISKKQAVVLIFGQYVVKSDFSVGNEPPIKELFCAILLKEQV